MYIHIYTHIYTYMIYIDGRYWHKCYTFIQYRILDTFPAKEKHPRSGVQLSESLVPLEASWGTD